MVDESSMSASIASKLTSSPQDEHESAGTAENENCKKKSQSEMSYNHDDDFPVKNVCPKPASAFQTPTYRCQQKENNRSQTRHHQHQQTYHHPLTYGSPFKSPIAVQRQSSGIETIARQRIQKHQDRRRGDDLNFVSSLTQSVESGAKTKILIGDSESKNVRLEPLILDPSAKNQPGKLGACNSEHRRITLSSSTSQLLESKSGNSNVQKLFQVATKGIRDHHATAAQYFTRNDSYASPVNARRYLHVTPMVVDAAYRSTASSAGVFARSNGVVQAGFLRKLGKNIPEFKRRFFVLKAETKLYYYLSPHDSEPRGKIDLEGTTIKQAGKTPDGRLRFFVSFKNENCDFEDMKCRNENGCGVSCNENVEIVDKSYQQRQEQEHIVLEARSTEVGEEWIRLMKEERVSYLKEENESLNITITKQANQIADLEKQMQHFRMIEADRDGALEDAKNWKCKFNRLDEALRLLTQRIRKSITNPLDQNRKVYSKDDDSVHNIAKSQKFYPKNENVIYADNGNDSQDLMQASFREKEGNKVFDIVENLPTIYNNSASSLLDGLLHENMDVEEIMDVPGTYFSSLSNACKQQNESSRLASVEASAAVEDVLQANEQVDLVQKRIHKAEKQILKLWEENCDIRKTLKQKKREKRVLVNEVKQLQQTVQDLRRNISQSSNAGLRGNETAIEDGLMADTMIGSDEERLIVELEEHVASSIRLHEQLLAGTDFDCNMEQSISTEPTSIHIDTIDSSVNGGSPTSKHSLTSNTKLLSLFDDKSDSDGTNGPQQDLEDSNCCIEVQSIIESVTSSTAHMATVYQQPIMNMEKLPPLPILDSNPSLLYRKNPLLEVNGNQHEVSLEDNSVNTPISKLVTENGQATSRLACPLADVIDVRGFRTNDNEFLLTDHEEKAGLRVHHLTFYSKKIGIQFQRACPAPMKSRGLITDAITADLSQDIQLNDKTADELKSIPSVALLGKDDNNSRMKEMQDTIAMPEDIVLVCGFEGFDNSGFNHRPNLGARLVAFDGVSVEEGEWTFECIRKAIQSRGRPLTLSFRNDFLTTEQREILTKAIEDVDAKRDIHFHKGYFTNESLDISTVVTEESTCWTKFPSSSGSVDSIDFKDNQIGRLLPPLPPTSSVFTHESRHKVTGTTKSNFSAANEVGNSSAVSALMNKFVKRVTSSSESQQEDKTILGSTKNIEEGAEQTRRFDSGINPSGSREHQKFQANLL